MHETDSGSYICLARNSLGASDEITASIQVQYEPRDVATIPNNFIDLEVGDKQVRMDLLFILRKIIM